MGIFINEFGVESPRIESFLRSQRDILCSSHIEVYEIFTDTAAHLYIGINLANAEMCLALSTLARYQMKLFETDESDIKFQHDYQISHPKMGSKGVRVTIEESLSRRR